MRSVFERSRLLGFGILVVTFLAGGLAGAAVDRVLAASEAPVAESHGSRDGDGRRYVIDQIEMDPDQRSAIDAILEERAERMRAVWREVEPRMDAITDSVRRDIMSILTPAQRTEYDRKLEERRERRERDRQSSLGAPVDGGAPGAGSTGSG